MTEPDAASERMRSELDRLDAMTVENLSRTRQIRARIKQYNRALDTGRPLADLVAKAEEPLLSALIATNIESLHQIGADFRRAEVALLRASGLTMEQIAELLGVTRQRISAMIKADSAV